MPVQNEVSLRRLAKRKGYALRKSRTCAIHANDLGDYMLVNLEYNVVALGGNFEASLDDVAEFLK